MNTTKRVVSVFGRLGRNDAMGGAYPAVGVGAGDSGTPGGTDLDGLCEPLDVGNVVSLRCVEIARVCGGDV